MAETVVDLRDKRVDVTPFKRSFVIPDEVTIASVRMGFQYNAWDTEKIPQDVLDDLEKAYPQPDKHAKFNPNLSSSYLLYKLGKFEEALKYCDDAINLEPDDPKTYYHKGDILCSLKRYGDAVQCYEKAIEAEPDTSDVFYKKCYALLERAQYKEAVKCCTKATEVDPSDPLGYYYKGNALSGLEKYEKALECYDEAIYIDPDNPRPLYCKSSALSELGRHEEAKECYAKAVKADPGSIAVSHKCMALVKLGRFDEAAKYLEKMLEFYYGEGSDDDDGQRWSVRQGPASRESYETVLPGFGSISWNWQKEKLKIAQ